MSQPQKPQFDTKNMIMAVALSMLIVFGWQYYYAGPAAKKAQEATQTQETVQATIATDGAGQVKDRASLIAATKRVKIDTPDLAGSINLTGALLDDLELPKYHETIDDKSPVVTLLSPSGAPNAYFVEQGFVPKPGSTIKVPDSKTEWQVEGAPTLTTSTPVTLTWDNGEGLKFAREISISDNYLFTVKQTVTNSGTAPVDLIPYGRAQRQDTPQVAGYWVFYEGPLGVQNGGLEEHKYAALKKDPDVPATVPSKGGWLGFTDKYWAAMLIPDQETNYAASYRFVKIPGRDAYQTDFLATAPITVPAGGSATYEDHVYAGAKIVSVINSIFEKFKFAHFDLMIDWGWFAPITKFMFYLVSFVHSIVGNFGVAILVVTLLVKLAVFPLANRSYASMSKMKNLKPQMDAIKEKYPDDKMKQQQETMALYKEAKVNPMAGCLPIFVQIPVFFSLYKVILTTIELRHAPFFGWIHDLSAPDPTTLFNLFGLIPWTPPHALMIGFWPLLMGITMWVQMRLNPTPPDPIQQQMFNWMPVIFTFSLGTFPAGLVIYWAWSNTLSILQQSYIMKKHGTELNLFGNIKDSIPFLKKKPAAT
ncbi:membrane protein insertase YidC [Aestuariivirga litoralis]|uniref:membrane protein insertase YidC n=1 Tax=Aestuariivirga litoralis TaxID=2650924 RepID=UPI0018C57729|nr:membrane protein insertase YidC [Aestuariivirga litoralis]MBG1232569.1 membrane protein insertase YidC [Aestuariivirga litoralis]